MSCMFEYKGWCRQGGEDAFRCRPGNPKAQDVSLFVVQRLQEGPEPQMSSLAPFKPSHREVYKDPPESEMCMEY